MMNKDSRIYIAGHTGLIGSAIYRRLNALGYRNLIVRTHKELDLVEKKKTERFFMRESPEYVFLAAAKVGGIHANNAYPADFIYQNIMIQTNMIDLAYKYDCKKLLFIACSCVYPRICKQPMKEEYLLTGPLEPTNEPFAIAKIAGISMCQSYNRQYGTDCITVIPANTYGINDHFDEDGHVIAGLIKKFHEAKMQGLNSVTVWGTGRPRRDFLYVDDVADACIFLMNKYTGNEIINIGSGMEISIKKLVYLIKKITEFKGRIIFDISRPDGMPRKFLDAESISRLGWRPKIEMEEGLKITYKWYKDTRSSD